MNNLVDTHCHIHSATAGFNGDNTVGKKWHDAGITEPQDLISTAQLAGVEKLICVGTDVFDSHRAVDFVQDKPDLYAAIGVHPHEAESFMAAEGNPANDLKALASSKKVIAVGEIGLDNFYQHSSRSYQIKALELQLDLAQSSKLPVIFHVREAYKNFWPIVENFPKIKGILHSYADNQANLIKALDNGYYIGQNGIITFTKNKNQFEVCKMIPDDRLVVETDAPYLTPKPYRGKICKPEHVKLVYKFLSELRGENIEQLADQVRSNVKAFFSI